MIEINFSPAVDKAKTEQLLGEIATDPMGGWFKLPLQPDVTELSAIKQAAKQIQSDSAVLVCIGIGGSYLGHRAIIEALRPTSPTSSTGASSTKASGVDIIYAGNSLSRRELDHALAAVGDRDFSINVISKSGTTLEPALAFAAFKEKLIAKYGPADAAKRIYATTDANTGTLHDEATAEGYTRFVVPDNIGGRYSVLTAVGLLPLAAAGVDVDALLAGAREIAASVTKPVAEPATEIADSAAESVAESSDLTTHPAVQYAWMRYELASKGYDTEVFASFEPSTAYFNEWLKQLFGESEGKGKQGVWPASVVYSTDLHSLGQFMQDGRRNLWETILDFPTDATNQKVVQAVKIAHMAGGIPVLTLKIPSFDEHGFGELIYFFELSCALSAKLSGVNPFDQPGVEAYKTELRRLLA